MVRRLVHDEEIRLGGQHYCQCYPFHFSSGEVLHKTVSLESETGNELLDPQFISEKSVVVQSLCELLAGVHYLCENVLFGVMGEFLLQKRYSDMLEKRDLSAGIRLVVASQNSEQRGLAGAVRCDESDFVALIDVETDMLEKHFRSVTLAYIFYL